MTAKEIRSKEANRQEAIFLREIAAQLAEFVALCKDAMEAENGKEKE